MGIFSRKRPDEHIVIDFGFHMLKAISSLNGNGANNYPPTFEIRFPEEILNDINEAVSSHEAVGGVFYSDTKQFLDVVGESFHQKELNALIQQYGRDRWLYGFLMPEPFNPHDENAVMVLLITKKEDGELDAVPVGYLARDQAKRVSKSIIKILKKGGVIPVLAMVKGGTAGKENYGVLARAMTTVVTF